MNQDHEPFSPGASEEAEASGEHATKAVYLTQGEINALQKAILFLKFESEETAPYSMRAVRYLTVCWKWNGMSAHLVSTPKNFTLV
ncbi:hypothetical protein [Paenibacillus sp. CFBP 13594]|uniref:hypothetical protein n=1 Tax=Paenibacillus sp. CFBP 13594 TaxID=2774037 RepID=UPI001A7E8927|nr:hypothetical protein [Paenibacillus sp. CFBP 13594]